MPIAAILEQGLGRLDAHSLLALALQEDRARRLAIITADLESAIRHQRERNALVRQWELVR